MVAEKRRFLIFHIEKVKMRTFSPSNNSSFDVGHVRIAIVVARWNGSITENLLIGAKRGLADNGIVEQDIDVFRVPGAFELPLACQKLAQKSIYDGIIALGCVIRGGTPHFEYICGETTRGIGQVTLQESLPIGFGLLTTNDLEQSELRSGVIFNDSENENKGKEAALTVLEMISLFSKLGSL